MKTKNSNLFFVGIDAGSVSINCAVIDAHQQIVCELPYLRHFGKVEEEITKVIRTIDVQFGLDRIGAIAFTGCHGQRLSAKFGALYEFETIAQISGVLHMMPEASSIISMGGQSTALFQINHQEDDWALGGFNTNGPCAAGTGSFIDQQAERLATALYENKKEVSQAHIDHLLKDFIKLGLISQRPANVACRCTVFTKSDMIHLQNRGERLEDIIYGLHVGNARNYVSTIVSRHQLRDPIIFIGGMSLNTLQVKAFKTYYPHLIVPARSTSCGAIGVALKAMHLERTKTVKIDDINNIEPDTAIDISRERRLELNKTRFFETDAVQCDDIQKENAKAYLGIDIGSTTTKYALIDPAHNLLHKCYVPTRGKPIEVTQTLLKQMAQSVGYNLEILGVATTGSGRYVVGDFLNADLVIDEITAHARGAVEADSHVDTIFEIGGQDSKYIRMVDTHPLDFDMNKVCAAGTGSFLHELASKYGVNIVGEFEQKALASRAPVKLTDRCTVFMESDLVSYYRKGVCIEDLMAGLCYAIVHNYLNRVVGNRTIGQEIMFLGGPSLNQGVVAAFENILDCAIRVPMHREVLGAYGAAVCVHAKMDRHEAAQSTFRGLQKAINDCKSFTENVCRADKNCHNQCKLKIYDFDGRRSIWGGECGRFESTRSQGRKKENHFKLRQMLWETHMAGVYHEIADEPLLQIDGRPTIGMQRTLYTQHTGVLWAHFFDQLGYRLVLTPPTNASMSKRGVEAAVDGACYPVKVSHGHMQQLIDKTRYIFAPTVVNMPTPKAAETGYYCPMVQSNAYMVQMALKLNPAVLLNPTLHLKHDPDTLALEIFEQIGSRLGLTLNGIKRALYHGLAKQRQFVNDIFRHGVRITKNHPSHQPLVVITGRPYNLYDERLNLRLGQNLADIGLTGISLDFMDTESVDLSDFPSIFWGLGAQILRTAKTIKDRPNYFGLHLTNFGCGADSFIEHFYKHIMAIKPYLILELDEHSASAGVKTRLEAFQNVIANSMRVLRSTTLIADRGSHREVAQCN